MKKLITLLGTSLLLLAIAAAALLHHWTDTPHGRLTVPSALISRVAAWQQGPLAQTSVETARAARRRITPFLSAEPIPVGAVRDEAIAGPAGAIAIRIYAPEPAGAPLPAIVYLHGGGWVFGDLDSHDNVCRALARKSGAIVVAVAYRLAPEHPYPAAVDDAFAALAWVAANAAGIGADPARLAVAGDSAGGNLAAALTLLARERGGPPLRAQALVYPGVDMVTQDRDSLRDFATGLFLTRENLEWFKDRYVPERARRAEPLASPLLAGDHRGLPPALVVTAQFDPLRDEGEAYATALARAGVPVAQQRFEGVIHGFVSMDRWIPESAAATDLIGAWLRERLHAPN